MPPQKVGLLWIILHLSRFDDCHHVQGARIKGCLGESDAGVSVLCVGRDGLRGASDSTVGDVSAPNVIHSGGVSPESVDGRVRVVSALV